MSEKITATFAFCKKGPGKLP